MVCSEDLLPQSLACYLDACATTPPATAVLAAMAEAQQLAWANPSSLHGYGLEAAECLERSRSTVATQLGCDPEQVVFTSGGSESIHLALQGAAAQLPTGRLLISSVEHPATEAAAACLQQGGWQVARVPVDRRGMLQRDRLEELLQPPTRLMSLIWGQNEVGSIQDLERIGRLCRSAGVLLHVDAVQVVGHQRIRFADLPIDLLSLAAHKLQGPRGIGALLVKPAVHLAPLIGGGGQERGRRGGTEPVVLAAGLAAALVCADQRLLGEAGRDPLEALRNQLLGALLELPGVRLSGPPVAGPHTSERLPHHISLLVGTPKGVPLSGRRLVQALWREGYAVSSGSACSSSRSGVSGAARPSAVLSAMGYSDSDAASGLRISLGPWLAATELFGVVDALDRVRRSLS